MYKFIIICTAIVTVNCGLLGNVLEDKKKLDSNLNSAVDVLDKEADGLTGLLAGADKSDDASKKVEETTPKSKETIGTKESEVTETTPKSKALGNAAEPDKPKGTAGTQEPVKADTTPVSKDKGSAAEDKTTEPAKTDEKGAPPVETDKKDDKTGEKKETATS